MRNIDEIKRDLEDAKGNVWDCLMSSPINYTRLSDYRIKATCLEIELRHAENELNQVAG